MRKLSSCITYQEKIEAHYSFSISSKPDFDSMSIRDRHQRTTKKNIWTDTWLLEIIASVLSLLCLGVLVLVFVVSHGKPTQVRHGLTLNTLVSILSTAARSAALLLLSSAISQWRWCLFKTQHRSLVDFEYYDTASLVRLAA